MKKLRNISDGLTIFVPQFQQPLQWHWPTQRPPEPVPQHEGTDQLWMTTFWTRGPQYPGSEEEASPALMTMRKQSSADRRARAGPAAGAELFDGETMWVEHFLHNHNGKGQREGKIKTRDEKEEKEKSTKFMSLPETFSSATWLCNLTWRLCSCCLNYSHRNKLLPHNAMVSTKHPY